MMNAASNYTFLQSFELYQNRLLIFKVNEEKYNASGCSIDKQVRFVKELEQAFSLELLDRLLVAYENNNQVEVVKSAQIKTFLLFAELFNFFISYSDLFLNTLLLRILRLFLL